MNSNWSKISLIFLFLVALIGTLLRSVAYLSTGFEYTHLVHAHSHVAFQGWVYTIMVLLLTNIFLRPEQIQKGRYPLQFVLTIGIVAGVLVSFALQGYALFSILFSTLFQLLNYWFIYRFLKDVKSNPVVGDTIALRFIKTGLWFGVLSTILPFAIGIASAKGLNGTELYQSLVFTFLHLQYNGWFLFIILGLFFQFLHNNKIEYHSKFARVFYWLLSLSVVPAIALSLLGMKFGNYVLPLAYLAAAMLGLALVYFLRSVPRKLMQAIQHKSTWFKLYFFSFLVSCFLKMSLQVLSAIPYFEQYGFHNKSIIIGYLHLTLIGAISFLLIAMLFEKKWLISTIPVKIGSILLLLGFVVTELLLVADGLRLYYNSLLLIAGSCSMAIGILLLVFSPVQKQVK